MEIQEKIKPEQCNDDSFVFKLRNELFDRFTANNGFYKQAFRGARFAFLMVFAFDKARGRTLQT